MFSSEYMRLRDNRINVRDHEKIEKISQKGGINDKLWDGEVRETKKKELACQKG